jgi:hypothetical protein
MVLKWVTEEFDLRDIPDHLEPSELEPLEQSIKAKLSQLGEVRSWIATDVDVSRQKMIIDALIWAEDPSSNRAFRRGQIGLG